MISLAATLGRTLCIALMAAAGLACSRGPEVSGAIRSLIDQRQADVVRLADATPFAWDQVYLFDPYAPRSHVCATLHLAHQECRHQVPRESSDDGVMTMAFLADGKLVHYLYHRRIDGDFAPAPSTQPLTPRTAVFRILREDNPRGASPWYRLVLE